MTHFTNLQRSKRKRLKSNKGQKEQRKNNKYSEYDWEDLITSQKIKKLVVVELSKYLEHHNLSKQGTKEDKIKRITCHYLRGNRVTINNKNIRSTSLSGRNSSTETTATVKMNTVMAKIQMKIMKF